MKTITITLNVTAVEYDLLHAAQCDQPHPERIKAMLIAEASRVLRMLVSNVADERNQRSDQNRSVRGSAHQSGGVEERLAANGRLRAAVNKSYHAGKRTRESMEAAHARIDKSDAEIKASLAREPLVLSKPKTKAKVNHSDHSAAWLDDENVARIKA